MPIPMLEMRQWEKMGEAQKIADTENADSIGTFRGWERSRYGSELDTPSANVCSQMFADVRHSQ